MGWTNRIPADLAPQHDPREQLTDQQAEYITGLRELADFLTEHPTFIEPARPVIACRYAMSDTAFRELAQTVDATFSQDDEQYRRLVRWFGPHEVAVYTRADPVTVPSSLGDCVPARVGRELGDSIPAGTAEEIF